jgi:Protein of unknown function (DUF3467)
VQDRLPSDSELRTFKVTHKTLTAHGGLVPERSNGETGSTAGMEGKYANYFQIGHSEFEFLIDCGQMYSEEERARFHTRIITSPFYAKELLRVLSESLNQYEESFGPIRDDE